MPDAYQTIDQNEQAYPQSILARLQARAPFRLVLLGNAALLTQPALGMSCSERCPTSLNASAKTAEAVAIAAGINGVSGFQSPVERSWLIAALPSTASMIAVPAQPIDPTRLRDDWRVAFDRGRLLFVMAHDRSGRPCLTTPLQRHLFVAALARAMFVVYAAPDGNVQRAVQEIVTWSIPLLTLANPANSPLVKRGIEAIQAQDLAAWWAARFDIAPEEAAESDLEEEF